MIARIENLTRHYADGFQLKDSTPIRELAHLMKNRAHGVQVRLTWECEGNNFELNIPTQKVDELSLSVSLLPDASGLICFAGKLEADNAYILDPYGRMRYGLRVPYELTGLDIPQDNEMWFRNIATHKDGKFGVSAWIEGSGSGGYAEGDWYFELDYHTGKFLWGREIRI